MIESLRVKNLAIVEDATLEFGPGLNVITGETGAGKSILIGALGLLLGERADKTMIRTGEKAGNVEAVFQLADSSGINSLLEEMGLDSLSGGSLIIRRTIPVTGSGRVFINDSPATVQALKKIGNLLVDLHGPHDHQSLLDPDFQLDLLDSFGHLKKERSEYAKTYRKMKELETGRRALDGDDQAVARQIDLLRYQVSEIEEAGLGDIDEDKLKKEHAEAANARTILELANGICRGLTGEEESVFNTLVSIRSDLAQLSNLLPDAVTWEEEAEGIAIQFQEISDQIAGRVDRIEVSPERVGELEDRLSLLQKLKRKYGGTVEEILLYLSRMEIELNELETREERIAEIEEQLGKQERLVRTAGKKLGKRRRKAAGDLAKKITGTLRELGFPHGAFNVTVRDCPPRDSGMDEVEFDFAPNAGEASRPLRTIASSGEISRVMLASKAVLAAHDRIPVLVFDEIDANLGGEMGNAVGEKLAAVSRNHQVLCITHLPQVAVHGQNHLVVSKEVRSGRTLTGIMDVEGESRAEEVARMLGGKDLTTVVLDHAREMLLNVVGNGE
ncbi:MAG: DNA repair protein RecN [Candidatus Auribacterota bacterium]|nr:DNA repair protein RecN [Candidatus Auribacterota bacterium]